MTSNQMLIRQTKDMKKQHQVFMGNLAQIETYLFDIKLNSLRYGFYLRK